MQYGMQNMCSTGAYIFVYDGGETIQRSTNESVILSVVNWKRIRVCSM